MGIAVKRPVLDGIKPSFKPLFVIFDIRTRRRSAMNVCYVLWFTKWNIFDKNCVSFSVTDVDFSYLFFSWY